VIWRWGDVVKMLGLCCLYSRWDEHSFDNSTLRNLPSYDGYPEELGPAKRASFDVSCFWQEWRQQWIAPLRHRLLWMTMGLCWLFCLYDLCKPVSLRIRDKGENLLFFWCSLEVFHLIVGSMDHSRC
jgi:hypothetical protein